MDSQVLKARSFCKVNLALEVLGRRPDGYHEIRTVFQTIDLHDELEIRDRTDLDLRCSGLEGLTPEENLVWKAACSLRESAGVRRGAAMMLRKRVPAGAGLGGGSSNAATTLLALNRFWNLGLSLGQLAELAASLGSDVAFFLQGGTALGIGRGEEIYPLEDPPAATLVVIFPGIHVSTAAAYAGLNLSLTSWKRPLRIQQFCGRLEELPSGIFNDFETTVLPAYAGIREAKSCLDSSGATATLLSGSGSSVFGFFREEESALAACRAAARPQWRVFPAKTLSRSEYIPRVFG
jgi:4-diphosphocytidyl-2-C-methyl-D-erythritol kinase